MRIANSLQPIANSQQPFQIATNARIKMGKLIANSQQLFQIATNARMKMGIRIANSLQPAANSHFGRCWNPFQQLS